MMCQTVRDCNSFDKTRHDHVEIDQGVWTSRVYIHMLHGFNTNAFLRSPNDTWAANVNTNGNANANNWNWNNSNAVRPALHPTPVSVWRLCFVQLGIQ